MLSQKSGLIKSNTTFMTGNIQKMAEVRLSLSLSLSLSLNLSLSPTPTLTLSLSLSLSLSLTLTLTLITSPQPKPTPEPKPKPKPQPQPKPGPHQALWNLATKKGGLKPAEQRGAFLLFLTWIFYVVGGVSGAALAGVLEAGLTQPPRTLSYPLSPSFPNPSPPHPHRHPHHRRHSHRHADDRQLFDWSLTPAALIYGAGMASMEVNTPSATGPHPTPHPWL